MLLVGGLHIRLCHFGTSPTHLRLVAIARGGEFAELRNAFVNDPLFSRDSSNGPLQAGQHFLSFAISCGFIQATMRGDTFGQSLSYEWVGPSILSDKPGLFELGQQAAMLQRVVT